MPTKTAIPNKNPKIFSILLILLLIKLLINLPIRLNQNRTTVFRPSAFVQFKPAEVHPLAVLVAAACIAAVFACFFNFFSHVVNYLKISRKERYVVFEVFNLLAIFADVLINPVFGNLTVFLLYLESYIAPFCFYSRYCKRASAHETI